MQCRCNAVQCRAKGRPLIRKPYLDDLPRAYDLGVGEGAGSSTDLPTVKKSAPPPSNLSPGVACSDLSACACRALARRHIRPQQANAHCWHARQSA